MDDFKKKTFKFVFQAKTFSGLDLLTSRDERDSGKSRIWKSDSIDKVCISNSYHNHYLNLNYITNSLYGFSFILFHS